MDTENRAALDEHEGEAAPRVRLDSAQFAPPSPHAFDLPDRGKIERLSKWLDGHEININEFGERLARHDGLNHSALDADLLICKPTHAAAFLGQRALRHSLVVVLWCRGVVVSPADACDQSWSTSAFSARIDSGRCLPLDHSKPGERSLLPMNCPDLVVNQLRETAAATY